jgi:hypothetical protein
MDGDGEGGVGLKLGLGQAQAASLKGLDQISWPGKGKADCLTSGASTLRVSCKFDQICSNHTKIHLDYVCKWGAVRDVGPSLLVFYIEEILKVANQMSAASIQSPSEMDLYI